MFKEIISEAFYGVKSTAKFFSNNYPDEQVVFTSATTLSEFKDSSRIGTVRRGVIICTGQQIFFKSVFLSLHTGIYLTAASAIPDVTFLQDVFPKIHQIT